MAVKMTAFRGDRLKAIRAKRGLSQEAFAALMSEGLESTVPQQLVSQWESGSREPGSETLVRMANALTVSIDYLLGLVNDPADRIKATVTLSAIEERLLWELKKGHIPEALQTIAEIAKGGE